MSRSIGANAIAMFAARLLPPMFAFTVQVAVARLGGAEMLGGYVSLLAVLMIFQAIAGAGLQFLVSRDIAAAPERAAQCAREARTFSFVAGVIGTALYVVYAWWLLPAGRLLPALVLATTVVPSAWIALQEAIFIGTRTHHWIAVVAVAENTIKAVFGVMVLVTGHGLLAVCVVIAAARLVGLVTGAWLVRRAGVTGSWRLEFGAVLGFTRTVAPFSVLFVLSMVYFRIDVPIVQALAGDRMTGFYGAAVALNSVLLLVPDSALAAAYPRLARAFRTSPESYAHATWVIAKLLSLALAGMAVVLMCFSDLAVRILFGPAFTTTAPLLRLLAICLPVHALNGALGQALQAGGQQRAMVRIVVGGVVLHVTLNLLLVRMLGVTGAPVAMITSASLVALGTLHALHTRVLPMTFSARCIPALLSIVGPLVLVAAAPAELRFVAGAIGLVWLVAGAFWHGTLEMTDMIQMRAALDAPPAGAAL